MKITNDDGEEIEVYTAAEVAERDAATRATVEGEFAPKLTAAEAEKVRLDGLLKERADEFKGFRKLSDEQVAQLGAANRVIYENGLALAEANDKNIALETKNREAVVDGAIRAKVGTDQKAFDKVKEMYTIIGIEANTPEEIERKVSASIGAISNTEPNILGSAAVFSGGAMPPRPTPSTMESYADTEAGKAGAAELGLVLEVPKK